MTNVNLASVRPSTNLIVNYLPQHMTDRELYSMFITIGPVLHAKVMRDKKTGYSYGFGFVNLANPEDTKKAISDLDGLKVYNKRIKVSYARPPGDDIKETNLYVTNLPRHYKEEDLEKLFGTYGTIIQKNLLLDKLTGFPRGVAFVRFNLKQEAKLAIEGLNGQIPLNGNERLSVRIAEELGKQKASYYAGFQTGLLQSQSYYAGFQSGLLQSQGRPRFNDFQGRQEFASLDRSDGIKELQNNDNLVSYPIRFRRLCGSLAFKREQHQQRYNPIYGIKNTRPNLFRFNNF